MDISKILNFSKFIFFFGFLDKAIASRIDEESLKLGLIIRPIYHTCVLSPALIISKKQIDELVDKLYKAISNATRQLDAEGLWKA